MHTDLEKLRRFCLTAALVLTTYLLADISITANAEVKILDVPFTIKRLRVVHSGFALPTNATTIRNLSEGWTQCVDRIGAISREQ